MAELIDALPGVSLPVKEVVSRLAEMWQEGRSGAPSEFRALQMNVVLHFGLETSPQEARDRFDAVVRFAQRYPSRIIVLCPVESGDGAFMKAKLFSQCFIGDSHREMCCCEALLLSFKAEDEGYLANQVSVWIESDLPTYHWFHRVPAERVGKYQDDLLKNVRRVIYDGGVEPTEMAELDWPDPDRVKDLAAARLLPIRQALGQYLSGFSIEAICRGLKAVRIAHSPAMSGEARELAAWIRSCLAECGRCEDCPAAGAGFDLSECGPEEAEYELLLEFRYDDERHFRWRMFLERPVGEIEADLGQGPQRIPTHVKPLSDEHALAEALFF